MRNGCSLGMVVGYPLRFLPGKQFTGLPLLCWQPVGFQIAFPDTGLQIPLREAYAAAMLLYEAKGGMGKKSALGL